MPMRKLIIMTVLTLSLALAACGSVKDYIPAAGTDVAALNATLTATETGALAYYALPLCGATKAPVCKDINITRKIKVAAVSAYTAVSATDKAKDQSTLEAARTAVAAYANIISVVRPAAR